MRRSESELAIKKTKKGEFEVDIRGPSSDSRPRLWSRAIPPFRPPARPLPAAPRGALRESRPAGAEVPEASPNDVRVSKIPKGLLESGQDDRKKQKVQKGAGGDHEAGGEVVAKRRRGVR